VDAAPADADHTFDLVQRETIGPLRPGATEKLVIGTLGAPTKKQKPILEGATGEFASVWVWSDASIIMVADKDKGPWTARMITISGRPTFETRMHIHVGSTRAEVERAYERSLDDDGKKKETYLAGSMYGGLLFTFDHDKVVSISIGPFAF
jgi:hypothetical protein